MCQDGIPHGAGRLDRLRLVFRCSPSGPHGNPYRTVGHRRPQGLDVTRDVVQALATQAQTPQSYPATPKRSAMVSGRMPCPYPAGRRGWVRRKREKKQARAQSTRSTVFFSPPSEGLSCDPTRPMDQIRGVDTVMKTNRSMPKPSYRPRRGRTPGAGQSRRRL